MDKNFMEKNVKVYWLVITVILIMGIFVFIKMTNDSSDLVQYFSFAGSITSLVLGLVAIFYSMVSNQQSNENVGKLKETASKIEEGADALKSLSENINNRLDKISDDLVRFGTKEDKNQTAPKEDLESETPENPEESDDTPDDENENGKEVKNA